MQRRFMRMLSVLLSLIMIMSVVEIPASKVYAEGKAIEQTRDDLVIIPDKNNTGYTGNLIDYDACTEEEKKACTGGLEVLGGYIDDEGKTRDYVVNVSRIPEIEGWYIIKGVDFSKYNFYYANPGTKKLRVRFENCKFKNLRGNESVETVVEHCTLQSTTATNMTFNYCQFGHSYNDAIRAFNDVYLNNCFICDLQYTYHSDNPNASQHIDGLQIYGNTYSSDAPVKKGKDAGNIHLYNCRFEIPTYYIDAENKASMNDCIMVQNEYSDASNITFENIVMNGANYQFSAHKGQDHSTKEVRDLKDVSLKNARMGEGSIAGAMTAIDPLVELENVGINTTLYVASVTKDTEGKTHLSVTNDSCRERKLTIVTDKETKNVTIPAYPLASVTNVKDDKAKKYTYADYPIDMDIDVQADKYVVCYDTTYGLEQIRFVNYTDAPVVIDEDILNANAGKVVVIKTGKCGKNLQYSLTNDGVLTITGTGEMFNFHSASLPNWDRVDDSDPKTAEKPLPYIRKVVIGEGVTSIGAQAFNHRGSLQEVELPSTLEVINSRAFAGCSSIIYMTLPASLKTIGKDAFINTFPLRLSYLGEDFTKVEGGAEYAWKLVEHRYVDQPYKPNGDGTHYQECVYCGYHSAPEACSGGNVTCSHGAVCVKCNGIYGQSVSGNKIDTVIKNKKDVTCTEDGYTGDECCKDCGAIVTPGTVIVALGHVWNEGVITKQPTLSTEGEKTYTCSRCGEKRIEIIDVTATEKPFITEIARKGKLDTASIFAEILKGTENEGKSIAAYGITKKPVKGSAKITKKGLLKAKKGDTIEVTAYADKKKTEELATIRVVIKDTKLETKFTVKYLGDRINLKDKLQHIPSGQKIEFSMSDKMTKYATLNKETGEVKPIQNGKIKVKCTIGEGKNAAVFYTKIIIKTPVFNNKGDLVIKNGKTKKLTIKNVETKDDIKWSLTSSKAKIVGDVNKKTVVIEGTKAGETEITVKVNGHHYKKKIVVVE